MIKQVIVMRNDLNMRKGKMVAQGAHAALKVFLDRVKTDKNFMDMFETFCREKGYPVLEEQTYPISLTLDMLDWMDDKFTKICVRANSEEELVSIYHQAKDANLPVALITDSGQTEFHGVRTKTCLAIGPADADAIDSITGNLTLL
ncbi:aminoacyl-tRNA hydrolase [Aneurinibacillus sp. Ricciae_BoGa-3]|uniref:aminoacyl-tRNA hydrolase n=1 Tax=Aneurinibacillus sp. Ricciae_BoGa-3 TaxID=3022697 RepID=UPI003FA4467F